MARKDFFTKDYYQILDISRNASDEEIKKHIEGLLWSAILTKILATPTLRKNSRRSGKPMVFWLTRKKGGGYDQMRDYGFAQGAERRGFGYTQEDIFRDVFSNPFAREVFQDLTHEFNRYGFRFDNRFFNQIFFGGKGVAFGGVFFFGPGAFTRTSYHNIFNKDIVTPVTNSAQKRGLIGKIGVKAAVFC